MLMNLGAPMCHEKVGVTLKPKRVVITVVRMAVQVLGDLSR
jgi:hypothetical protein